MDTPVTISDRSKPARQTKNLTIGALIFPGMDQIDFTGPFEVLSRIPGSTIHVIAKTSLPVRDVQGLILSPEMTIAEAPEFDVLLVPGGFGQQRLMNDDEVLSLIRRHFAAGRLVFSVCTGALLCGAAGILRDRQATTHWAAWNLLPYYGAIPVRSRVVVDGNLVTAAGVTAGLDAAFVVASLLRGEATAQEIQLSIEYAPNPVFLSGAPDTAPAEVLQAFNESYSAIATSREAEARHFAAILGVAVRRVSAKE
ncbi:MAG TPA: DJ-1/PfpI family protein [Bryobacteraceae bacterium]|nr:DJ-1/PfpI family protein [Bryobacteraceae bacterium]